MRRNKLLRLLEDAAEIARDLTNYRTLCDTLINATAYGLGDISPHERLDHVLRELAAAREGIAKRDEKVAELLDARRQIKGLEERLVTETTTRHMMVAERDAVIRQLRAEVTNLSAIAGREARR